MSSKLEVIEPVTTSPSHEAVRFHLCLNVSSLDRSIEFFSAFFGCDPAKRREDYAKFEVEQPPLVLSLEPSKPNGIGVLNHVGLRMPSVPLLVEMQRRLETLGIKTQREEGVECCYARQTKFWLNDPDGTLWEVYTLDEDIDHHGYTGQRANDPEMPNDTVPIQIGRLRSDSLESPAAIWSHRLGQPFPLSLFVLPGSVDEIRLQGTFNAVSTDEQRRELLEKCREALSPHGKLILHQLTSDRPIGQEQLDLPGPASAVEQVLPIEQLIVDLEEAGFDSIAFTKYSSHPCFVRHGIELRETLLTASVSQPLSHDSVHKRVMYKGPATSVEVCGLTLKRGRFASVPEQLVKSLQDSLGDQLLS